MMRLTIIFLLMVIIMPLSAQDKTPTDKHFWHTLETTASPEEVWAVWMDVPKWKNWDTGLQDASLNGNMGLGAKGTILSLNGRQAKFKVVEFVEGKSYTYKTSLPLGGLFVRRYLETIDGKTRYTHEVWFKGLTSGVFAKALGGDFREMLPEVLLNIKHIVEGHSDQDTTQ